MPANRPTGAKKDPFMRTLGLGAPSQSPSNGPTGVKRMGGPVPDPSRPTGAMSPGQGTSSRYSTSGDPSLNMNLEMMKGQSYSDIQTQQRAQEDRNRALNLTQGVGESVLGSDQFKKYGQMTMDQANAPSTLTPELMGKMYGQSRAITEAQTSAAKRRGGDSYNIAGGEQRQAGELAEIGKAGILASTMTGLESQKALQDVDDKRFAMQGLQDYTNTQFGIEQPIAQQQSNILSNTITAPVKYDWNRLQQLSNQAAQPISTQVQTNTPQAIAPEQQQVTPTQQYTPQEYNQQNYNIPSQPVAPTGQINSPGIGGGGGVLVGQQEQFGNRRQGRGSYRPSQSPTRYGGGGSPSWFR